MGQQPIEHIHLNLLREAVARGGKGSPFFSDKLLSAGSAPLPTPEKFHMQLVILLLGGVPQLIVSKWLSWNVSPFTTCVGRGNPRRDWSSVIKLSCLNKSTLAVKFYTRA